jgi:hypothetical protein
MATASQYGKADAWRDLAFYGLFAGIFAHRGVAG